jgi:hypothetical protein
MGRNPFMLWFRKPSEEKEEKKPDWWSEWMNIQALCPIGTIFKYMDKDMMVIYHTQFHDGLQMPSINCSYADNHGVIHVYRFDISEWKLLTKLIKEAKK